MKEKPVARPIRNEELNQLALAESAEILAETTVTFEENLLQEITGGCDNHGCTCISYEKCCGCLIQ